MNKSFKLMYLTNSLTPIILNIIKSLTGLYMAVNLGGRGNKAPYEVTHTRVPAPIKETIQAWIDEWKIMFSHGKQVKPKDSPWEDNETKRLYPLVEEICAVQDEKLKAIEKLVNDYQDRSTHSERWKITDKLVNEIKAIL